MYEKIGRIWEKTVVKNSKMMGQYLYEQDEGVREERPKPLQNLQNSKTQL